MKKRIFTVCAALSVAAAVLAQGGITDEMMSQIRQGWQGTPEELALRNSWLCAMPSQPMISTSWLYAREWRPAMISIFRMKCLPKA